MINAAVTFVTKGGFPHVAAFSLGRHACHRCHAMNDKKAE